MPTHSSFCFTLFLTQAALELRRRPPMHALPVALFAVGCIVVLGRLFCLRPAGARQLAWLLTTSVLTHQMRDAWRRGLWLWPLVNVTLPVSYAVYLAFEALWPVFLAATALRPKRVALHVLPTTV